MCPHNVSSSEMWVAESSDEDNLVLGWLPKAPFEAPRRWREPSFSETKVIVPKTPAQEVSSSDLRGLLTNNENLYWLPVQIQ